MNKIPLYTVQGDAQEAINLTGTLLKKEENPVAFATAVRVLRQNWRQGTAACKTRGELAFSNKKPWKQKGTGRARVSSLRSPLWRKGGTIFGPQPRTRELSISQGQKMLAMNNVFFGMLENNRISCVDFAIANEVPSTKAAYGMLKKLGVEKKKVLLFMMANDGLSYAAFRNIPSVHIVFFDDPNVYDLAHADHWLFMKNDVEQFNTMVSKWN
jgi:large subunit ribosomal protein L4